MITSCEIVVTPSIWKCRLRPILVKAHSDNTYCSDCHKRLGMLVAEKCL